MQYIPTTNIWVSREGKVFYQEEAPKECPTERVGVKGVALPELYVKKYKLNVKGENESIGFVEPENKAVQPQTSEPAPQARKAKAEPPQAAQPTKEEQSAQQTE